MNNIHPRSTAVAATFSLCSASLADLFAIHALEKACFERDAWGYFEIITALLTPGTVRFKAMAGEHVVGFVLGDPQFFERFAWIATICVHPSYQKRGIGTALLTQCEANLKEKRFRLTVRASNSSAIALYQKHGYQQTGKWERYYVGGEDGVVMEKVKK